ncbi:MAG: hypothetical protein H0X37_21365 [Herpetosiphonaceae bacterium]|nr:hypothetical protein [Herpetosiphonaceae bacterium]
MKHRVCSLLLLVLVLVPTMAQAAPSIPTPDPMGMPGGMVMPTLPAATATPGGMVMPTPQLATTASAGPLPTPMRNFPTAQVAVFMARVRDLPNINGGSTVLELLAQGQTVHMYKQLADHSWYGVMTPAGGHGWMHVSVITFDPQILLSLPVAAGDLRVVDMPMGHPTAAPAAVDPPLAMAGLNQAEIVALPPADPTAAQAQAAPKVSVDLTLQVCFDQNGSKSCDEGDGVQDVIVQVSDTQTTELLQQGLTDRRGVIHMQLQAPEGTTLRVAVPAIPIVQTVLVAPLRPGELQRPPITLTPVLLPTAALPWPLP